MHVDDVSLRQKPALPSVEELARPEPLNFPLRLDRASRLFLFFAGDRGIFDENLRFLSLADGGRSKKINEIFRSVDAALVQVKPLSWGAREKVPIFWLHLQNRSICPKCIRVLGKTNHCELSRKQSPVQHRNCLDCSREVPFMHPIEAICGERG